ncbi:DUF1127 domain-containing protein [Mesorhizobium sp. BAC0120]|uniref:DUF1127 domain-containing protein n=1 Tax=Mesorhizobium sp. BAC0120 TaxID=3090670 RepID=UPI00298D1F61|nr:DUF1127 domain-containing protein [Mesorhizobium sp. BAC0120]MDW6022483.1 DUF1127 domain-containing protein [Mesorhizobium sp. BAC0120]
MSTVSMHSSNRRQSSLPGKIRQLLKTYWVYLQNRSAARALARLDDCMLKDMGISRSQIRAHVYRTCPDRMCQDYEEFRSHADRTSPDRMR